MTVTEGDLVLTGVNVPSYGFSAFSYDAVAHRATWTISQNLSRDKLLLDLDGSTANAVADTAGNRLDGEWTNPTWSPPSAPTGGDAWPSGDGTAGGDFQFRINVLPGDVNQDGTVNVSDLAVLAANYRKSLTGWANGDFNCDGVVNVSDLAVLAANYRLGLPVAEPVAPTRDVAVALESDTTTQPVSQPAGESSAALIPALTDVIAVPPDDNQTNTATAGSGTPIVPTTQPAEESSASLIPAVTDVVAVPPDDNQTNTTTAGSGTPTVPTTRSAEEFSASLMPAVTNVVAVPPDDNQTNTTKAGSGTPTVPTTRSAEEFLPP